MADTDTGREPTDAGGDPARGGGTEGPRGHEAGGRTDDAAVPRRVFLTIGGGLTVLALIYGATSYEESGIVLLALAAVLALWCGAYLYLQQRPRQDNRRGEVAGELGGAAVYLPHASVWPFAIGLGAATILNGLVLGTWVLVPGVGLLALGIGGWVRQTRNRD
jgi:ABC-type Fe3+ transport system permease subunit